MKPLALPPLGVYLPEFPNRWEALSAFERNIGSRVELVSLYQAWGSAYRDFDVQTIGRLLSQERIPLITWEPWRLPSELHDPSQPQRQPNFSLARILEGAFDLYIRTWARACSRFQGAPILLRPMHEMNGNWYPWGGMTNGNSPDQFIAAWRHIHKLFAEHGAADVHWVWSPYVISAPDVAENTLSRYYPGDDCVDFIALDGYNWGTSRPEQAWQSFDRLFSGICADIRRWTSKPVFIGETASSEDGGDKRSWIQEAFHSQTYKDYACSMVWFNANKECDWRIESSAAALEAFRTGVAQINRMGVPA